MIDNEMEKRRAIEFLIKIGCLIPFNNLELYHGRTAKDDKPGTEWKVDPNFNNSGNSTGNQNVNAVSLLSTSDYQTAREFADERNREAYGYGYRGEAVDKSKAQVFRIKSSDRKALIFNNYFDPNILDGEEKEEYERALRVLGSFGVNESSPLRFEDRNKGKEILSALNYECIMQSKSVITNDIVQKVQNKFLSEGKRYSLDLINQVAGAYNAKWFLRRYPSLVIRRYTMEKNPNRRKTIDGFIEGLEGPLNLEFFASWCHNNHIIGVKTPVYSATIGKNISNCMIFDKEKINTEKEIGNRMQRILSIYGEIEKSVSMFSSDTNFIKQLLDTNPQQSVDLMYQKGFSEAFELDAGVWEKFSVGEHTETALRIFEDTYEDEVPRSMVPLMKFILLVHDIGKGYAVRDRQKYNQKIYTEKFCRDTVFKKLKIEPKMQELLLFIIGEAQEIVPNIYLPGNDSASISENKILLINKIKIVLTKFLGRTPTKNEIMGIMDMSKILLACDGGSYSRYAVTRDRKTGEYYRNGNDRFTASFSTPIDMRKREVKFSEK